jgi:hypothetical protein
VFHLLLIVGRCVLFLLFLFVVRHYE